MPASSDQLLLADDDLLAPPTASAAAHTKSREAELAAWVNALRTGTDETAVITALQAVTAHMSTPAGEQEWVACVQLEALTGALHTQLRRVFGSFQTTLPVRTCKYLLNTLMELFKRPVLASAVPRKALQVYF